MARLRRRAGEVDRFVGVCEWREQCEPWEGAVRIIPAEPDTPAFYGVGFNPPVSGEPTAGWRQVCWQVQPLPPRRLTNSIFQLVE